MPVMFHCCRGFPCQCVFFCCYCCSIIFLLLLTTPDKCWNHSSTFAMFCQDNERVQMCACMRMFMSFCKYRHTAMRPVLNIPSCFQIECVWVTKWSWGNPQNDPIPLKRLDIINSVNVLRTNSGGQATSPYHSIHIKIMLCILIIYTTETGIVSIVSMKVYSVLSM